jgi:hypothetical protein
VFLSILWGASVESAEALSGANQSLRLDHLLAPVLIDELEGSVRASGKKLDVRGV